MMRKINETAYIYLTESFPCHIFWAERNSALHEWRLVQIQGILALRNG